MFDLLIAIVLLVSLLANGYSLEIIFVLGIFSVLTVVTLGLGLIYFDLSPDLVNWFLLSCLTSCIFVTYLINE